VSALPLPDVCTELQGDKLANEKARRILNKGFEKPRPRWGSFASGPFPPSQYRALILEGDCTATLKQIETDISWPEHVGGVQ
jgi:hypothetical protein